MALNIYTWTEQSTSAAVIIGDGQVWGKQVNFAETYEDRSYHSFQKNFCYIL